MNRDDPTSIDVRLGVSVTTTFSAQRVRVDSIDVLRGVVMILMALDHTRDFFGVATISPTDVAHASVALFFTRWITHLCAPTFFLLTGTGAYLSRQRRSLRGLSRFLFTRGLWLILLELTVLRCLGYQFNFDYRVTMLIILWALGWAMVTLAALVYLPIPAVGTIGVLLIATHNLSDSVRASSLGAFAPVWTIVHGPGIVWSAPQHIVFAAYPLIPWVGVTAVGYALGHVFTWAAGRRRAFLLRAGFSLVAGFMLLRFANIYGDPVRWSTQASAARTALSFLNAVKYPPSLLFLMMTLGPSLLLLAALDHGTPRVLRPALTLGRVPLFYFMLHLPLIHVVAVAVCAIRYGQVHWMFESPSLDRYPMTFPPDWGYSLPVVYVIWAAVVLTLFPVCRWFAGVKQRRQDAWLGYM